MKALYYPQLLSHFKSTKKNMAIFLHSLQPAILQSCCTAILRREESREGVECAGEIGLVTYLSLSLSLSLGGLESCHARLKLVSTLWWDLGGRSAHTTAVTTCFFNLIQNLFSPTAGNRGSLVYNQITFLHTRFFGPLIR